MDDYDRDDPGPVRDVLDRLLVGWHDSQQGQFIVRSGKSRRTTTAQFATVFGLCANAHAMATALRPHCDEGFNVALHPLVRGIFEAGVTAQWVAQIEDADRAFVNEGIRHRKNVRDTALRCVSEVFSQGTEQMAHVDDDYWPTSSTAAARNFQSRCDDLTPGGADAYIYYRLLSATSHAGPEVTDAYLTFRDEELRLNPHTRARSDWVAWMFISCCGLVWAARALDYLDKTHARRSELRAIAQELSISSEMHKSPRFYERMRGTRAQQR